MHDLREEAAEAVPSRPAIEPGCAVRVVVAASVRIYRDGLAQSMRPKAQVVAVTGNARSTFEDVLRHEPDVLLMDLSMPGAAALMRALAEEAPRTRLVAFAVDESHENEVLACAEAGAAGWVGPEGSAEELTEAVLHAARGELLVSARTAALLSRRVAALARQNWGPEKAVSPARLTLRESEVGEFLSRGLSNKRIAEALGMQLATVKNHVHNTLKKLEVRNRGEAAALLRGTHPPLA
jgi:two-component system, NarL family, nitrate/nitrite response regulator NarL